MMVYLDYNATTPTHHSVVDVMIPVFETNFGNPSSDNHNTGRRARELVDNARKSVAEIVGMKPSDVIFTSGATEANNMVFHGLTMNLVDPPKILVGATEHKSVLESCEYLAKQGAEVTLIRVTPEGLVDMNEIEKYVNEHDEISNNIDIVSVMAANSETGVVNSLKDVVRFAHTKGALVHCDATQAIGKIHFDAQELGIDLVTLSSHKIYGPKGCGALVATRAARKQMKAILHGGGQENNLRSGTLNVPGIVGFGKACEIAKRDLLTNYAHLLCLRDYFEKMITKLIPDVKINGEGANRLPNTSNITIPGALADAVIVNAPEIEISTGSACSSAAIEPSHVLTAMGLSTDEANESLRISIGRQTTKEDIDDAVKAIVRAVKFVRGKESELEGSMN